MEEKMNFKKLTTLFITLLVLLTATLFTACNNEPEVNPFTKTSWFSSFPQESYILFVSSKKYKFFDTDSEKYYSVVKKGDSFIANLHEGPGSNSKITETFTIENETSNQGILRITGSTFTNTFQKLMPKK